VAPHTPAKFGFLKNHFRETSYGLLLFDLKDFKEFLKKPSKKVYKSFHGFHGFYKN